MLAVCSDRFLYQRALGGSLNFSSQNQLLSLPNYRDLVEGTEAFSALAAFSAGPVNLGQGDATRRVFGESVTGNYFPAFGVSAVLGRTFGTEADGALGAYPVAVVSHGAWQRRFGADPGLVGKTIMLNGQQFTVIGRFLAPPVAASLGRWSEVYYPPPSPPIG